MAVVVLLVVAGGFAIAAQDDDAGTSRSEPPVVARLELDALPMLTFQAKELTTIAGVNQISLVQKGPSEAVAFDDPTLSSFRLAGRRGRPTVGTVDLHAGRDYRIHSVIPGHAAAGVDAVIHVLPAGAPGTPPLPRQVLKIVAKESQRARGPLHGRAEYAISGRNAAITPLMRDSVPDDQPVYVFVLHGSFVDDKASRMVDSPPPRGRVMTLTISRDAHPSVLDFGLGRTQPDLSVVGGAIRTRY